MADYLNIAGRVRTTASDGVAMEAQEVKDLNQNKSQQEINADVQTELGDRYTKEETYNKEQVNDLITTPDASYVNVVATNATTAVTDILPATGEANTIYRVGNWNGTQYDPTMYAQFAWNGSAYVCLAVRSFVGEVYDVSVNHPDGQGNPTPYADLAAALGTDGANIPADIRRGGMSIKFIQGTVQSSDNKYVKFFCTADNFTTDVTQWQGVDDVPTAGSENLVKSGGVIKKIIDLKLYTLLDFKIYNGKVSVNGKWGSKNTSYQYVIIPVSPGDVISITGNGEKSGYYAVLKTYTDWDVDDDVDFSDEDGFTTRLIFGATGITDLTIPDDGRYLYLSVIDNQLNTRPAKFSINGYELTESAGDNIIAVRKYAEGVKTDIENSIPSYQETEFNITPLKNVGFVRSSNGSISNGYAGFFYTDLIKLNKNETIKIKAKATSGSIAWLSKWESAAATNGIVLQASSSTMTEFSYTADEDMFVRLSNIDNEDYVFEVKKTILVIPDIVNQATKDIISDTIDNVVITVGSGKDYETLNEAVNSISDASKNKQYTIQVYEGEYETVVESEIVSGYKGLIIPDYVSIVGIGNRDNIIIKGSLPSVDYAAFAPEISTLNLTMNGRVENVTITSRNIRYCNHDDGGTFGLVDASHTFKNCKFITYLTDMNVNVQGIPIGIGGQWNKECIFEDCVFISRNNAGSHNNAILCHDGGINGVRLRIRRCVFDIMDGYWDIRLSNSGSTQFCYCELTGNKFTKGVRFTKGVTSPSVNVWNLYAVGNLNYDVLNSTSFDLTDAITAFGNYEET